MIVFDFTGIAASPSVSPGASLGTIELGLTTGAVLSDQSILPQITLTTTTVETPDPVSTEDGYSTVLSVNDQDFTDVTSVTVNGQVYPIGYPDEPGTFTFDPDTKTLVVTSPTPIPPGSTVAVAGFPIVTSPQTTLTTVDVAAPDSIVVEGGYSTVLNVTGQDLTSVTSVTVNGQVYPIGTPSQPGTFTFQPNTNTVVVTSSTPIPAGTTVAVTGLPTFIPQFTKEYPTNDLCEAIPEFLKRWNIAGSIQIDRTLKGWPSASFSLIVHKSEKAAVMAYFKPKQKISLYGCYFECSTPTVVEKPRDEFVEISIQLRGGWEREATGPVRLVWGTAQNLGYTTIAALCRRAGMGYIGPDVRIIIPRGTTRSASTTVMGEASSRGIRQNLFPFLSGMDGIEMRNYDQTRLHVLDPGDIMGPITHNRSGSGGDYNGVPLAAEYKNTELQLSARIDVSRNITEALESGHTNPRIVYKKLAVVGGEAVETVNSMEAKDSGVWWPSGPSKNWRVSIMQNNSPMEEEERVYALLGSPLTVYGIKEGDDGLEDYYLEGFNTQSRWVLVKEVRTRYEYGKMHRKHQDYLLKVVTRGWQYMNFSSSDLLELRRQYAEEEGGDGALLRSLYNQMMLAQFVPPSALCDSAYEPSTNAPEYKNLAMPLRNMTHKVPINETTTYTLAPMRDYYPDMLCRSDDPDFIEPMFCIEEERVSEDLAFAPDPRNITDTEHKRHPKITGQKRIERKTIEIIYPKKHTHYARWDQKLEKFRTITYSSNYVGGDLAQSSVNEEFTESLGRPGVHTRRIVYSTPWVVPLTTPETNKRIILNTPGSGTKPGDLEGGSVSFPDAYSVRFAVQAARNQIREQNLNAYTMSFDVRPCVAINWQEGDRIQLHGKLWTLLSISQIRNIEGRGRITADAWPVTLGLRMNIPVSVSMRECVA